MRHEKLKRLRDDSDLIRFDLEHLEHQMQLLYGDSDSDTELWHLARLLYARQLVEQSGLLYSLNEQDFSHLLAVNKHALQNPTD